MIRLESTAKLSQSLFALDLLARTLESIPPQTTTSSRPTSSSQSQIPVRTSPSTRSESASSTNKKVGEWLRAAAQCLFKQSIGAPDNRRWRPELENLGGEQNPAAVRRRATAARLGLRVDRRALAAIQRFDSAGDRTLSWLAVGKIKQIRVAGGRTRRHVRRMTLAIGCSIVKNLAENSNPPGGTGVNLGGSRLWWSSERRAVVREAFAQRLVTPGGLLRLSLTHYNKQQYSHQF
ncbi:30S ribosomal protein S7 [Striga asiatica]|uniref:30S ribosomal protein S7 n=1 Tax=Striga asiatica TaxID=4170 RepID=A0A5A7Q7L0_STRAF|nr:30S ribosomal protein S7 [Striga asiatica]